MTITAENFGSVQVQTVEDLQDVVGDRFITDLFTTNGGELAHDINPQCFETIVGMAVGSEVHLAA